MQDLLLLCCNASNDTTRPGQRMKVQMGHFGTSWDILWYLVIFCACWLISRSHLGARNLCIFVLSNFGIVWCGQALRPKTQLCSVAQCGATSNAVSSVSSRSKLGVLLRVQEFLHWVHLLKHRRLPCCSSFEFWLSYVVFLRLSQTISDYFLLFAACQFAMFLNETCSTCANFAWAARRVLLWRLSANRHLLSKAAGRGNAKYTRDRLLL